MTDPVKEALKWVHVHGVDIVDRLKQILDGPLSDAVEMGITIGFEAGRRYQWDRGSDEVPICIEESLRLIPIEKCPCYCHDPNNTEPVAHCMPCCDRTGEKDAIEP